jgi:FkbM family methyltransferase
MRRDLRAEAKHFLRRVARAGGLEVSRYRPGQRPPTSGRDPLEDIRALLDAVPRPVVFDVGANVGQSVATFRQLLPGCTIHSFEPGPDAFGALEAATKGLRNVHLVNAGVGCRSGRSILLENKFSDLSSLLRPGSVTEWGPVVAETEIRVTTVDDYCATHTIDRIDLLKIDTQGYELEVLRGAAGMSAAGKIGLVYMEVIFSDMYQDLPPFDVLYRFLLDSGFRLVALYNFQMRDQAASWCDALFAN